MARTSAFGFTNTTASTTDTVVPIKIKPTVNYSVTEETANRAVLNNKTAPVDVEEIISYKSTNIPVVNTDLNIQYPSPVKKGVQYMVMIEDTLSTTDSADPSFRIDEPIVAYLTIRHPKSGNIGNTQVATVVTRLISALKREDGTWRFDDFMRQAERPVVD